MPSFRRRNFLRVAIGAAALYVVLYGLPRALFGGSNISDEPPSVKIPQYIHPAVNFSALPPPPPRERKRAPVLGKHRYRKDGLLEVNLEGPHPIYELIARAEKDWEEKLSRASKTLQQAVYEYQRRYNRMPPKGFDVWWKYAQKHNIQLPDEYDTIFHDLEPFWGLDPADLIAIQAELEKKVDSYTIGKNETGGDVGVLTYAFREGQYKHLIEGSKGILKLFPSIKDDLPLFRMTISPHDGPNRLSDYGIKKVLLEAASEGRYISRASLPKRRDLGWISACPPDSLAGEKPILVEYPPPPSTKKTFIHNHVNTMNPCDNPNLFYNHGQFLSHNNGPGAQDTFVPEFSYCSTTLHHDIRFPIPYLWVDDMDDPEFDEKLDERLLWRGSNTGMFQNSKLHWEHSHRNFLVESANEMYGTAKVLDPTKLKGEKLGEFKELRKAHLNPALMDIAFTGNPISCSPGTCKVLEQMYVWKDYQSYAEAGNYKYVFDIDGNGWSGRFKRLMTTKSLIFKATIYPEWFADRVQPWVHYVPVQVDLTDLYDTLIFFRGDGNGNGAHEALAKKIATAGRQWSKTFWRKEDLISYLFRLTLEFARLMSEDRDGMSYREPRI